MFVTLKLKIMFILLIFFGLVSITFSQEIAKKKCEGYAKLARASGELNKLCGSGLPFDTNVEFSSFAVLGYTANAPLSQQFPCEAVLISEDTVVAAAHCLDKKQLGNLKWARLGPTGQFVFISEVEIKKIIIHPQYSPTTFHHDIALFRLSHRLNSSFIPACLDTKGMVEGEEGIAVGKVNARGNIYQKFAANYPTKAKLRVLPHQECKKAYPQRNIIPQASLCLKDLTRGHGDCLAGPFYVSRQPCVHSVQGIASFGAPCNNEKPDGRLPVIYTKLSYYLPWIESIVWPK